MSTVPLALPPLSTEIVPPENPDTLTGASTATLTPGIGASDGQTPLPLLQQIENIPSTLSKGFGGSGNVFSANGWFGERGVLMIIGLMLIAAGLFSLNGVKEKIILAGRTAAAAAA